MRYERKENMVKKVLNGLLLVGGIAIAVTSPFFIPMVLSNISKNRYKNRQFTKSNKFVSVEEKKKFQNTFYYLMRKGLIDMKDKNGQIFISLTDDGKKRAGKYQINDLKIEKSEKWDEKWRVLIFDIKNEDKIKREALRGKIKELGLYQLQKSVWIYPYEFQKEIKLLRSFFGLNQEEMTIITASEIEGDKKIKDFFKI